MYGDNPTNDANNQQPGGNTPPPMLDTPISGVSAPADPPSAPALDAPGEPTPNVDFSAGAPSTDTATGMPSADGSHGDSDAPVSNDSDVMSTPSSADDLLNIKQQALQQLTPLVDHLDQSPKEEFRTTMMMIQATDNQELVKKAFEAAQKIEDDKERAQAFLDIINEINYFTQHHEQ